MKILLTGSEGFLGSNYTTLLREQGHQVIPVDISTGQDLCNIDVVNQLPDVDVVVHFAALNGTKFFYDRPWDVIRSNILPTQYLLERYAGSIKLFVQAGTCESYAGSVDLGVAPVPTPESVPLTVVDVANPRWSYGGTKLTNEVQVHAAHLHFGMPFQILRFHNIYGPGQRNHFIPEFVDKLRHGDLTVQGGHETRAFCYVSDALDAASKLMTSQQCYNQIINVGNDTETTIKEAAEIIAKKLGVTAPLNMMPGRPGSVSRRCPDITLLKKLILWNPTIGLEHGIDLTLKSL